MVPRSKKELGAGSRGDREVEEKGVLSEYHRRLAHRQRDGQTKMEIEGSDYTSKGQDKKEMGPYKKGCSPETKKTE